MRYILIAVCFLTAPVFGQTVTGSWYGLADPTAKGANANNYLTELIIKQRGNEVEGVFGYYFRTGYQSYYIRGTYNPANRSLTIKNIPVTYYKSRDIDGIDCPMDLHATLMVSKVKSTLSGSFRSQEKYKYTCPELSFSYTLDVNEKNQDSLIRSNASNTKKYWKPRAEELVISAKEVSTPEAMAERMISQEAKDTAGKHSTIDSTAFKLAEAAKKKELEKLVTAFSARKNILNSEIEIESDSVRISFYDNGDIDGDSIAVFINKVPVLSHQPLSERALNMYLAMDSAHALTEISMYAENLGKYPPNTALMVIADGEKHHEVFLSSSLTQNAVVRLKKRKPAR